MSVATINPEVKSLWVEALRSGEYAQGKHALARKGYSDVPMKYCCLGVLCDLAVKAGVIEIFKDTRSLIVFGKSSDNSAHSLPVTVIRWAGLQDDVGSFNGYASLAGMNDYGKSFNEIADIIEKEFVDA